MGNNEAPPDSEWETWMRWIHQQYEAVFFVIRVPFKSQQHFCEGQTRDLVFDPCIGLYKVAGQLKGTTTSKGKNKLNEANKMNTTPLNRTKSGTQWIKAQHGFSDKTLMKVKKIIWRDIKKLADFLSVTSKDIRTIRWKQRWPRFLHAATYYLDILLYLSILSGGREFQHEAENITVCVSLWCTLKQIIMKVS